MHPCVTPLGEDSGKLVPDLPCISASVHFPFADFALYPFTVVNDIQEYDYMRSSVGPPGESQKLEVVLGTPT